MSTQTVIPSAAAPFISIEKVATNPSPICAIPVIGGPDALCDAQDFPFLSLFKWRVHGKGNTAYPTSRLAGKSFAMHQLVLRQSQKRKINHRDFNVFNNCRANLRFVTESQLQATRPKLTNRVYTSIYKGVSWNKQVNKWHAIVTFLKVRHELGYFDSEEAAARAYDKAAHQIFGEFANLNFSPAGKESVDPPVTQPAVSGLVNATGEKTIPLTNGAFAICDPETYPLLSCLTWRAERFGENEYAVSRIHGKDIFMHHLALRCGKRLRVVHRDGNGLNNQRANLFFPPCSNISSGKSKRLTTSRFKGVLRRKGLKWSAYITVQGKYLCLGRFENEEDAARAYDAGARVVFGPFAYQNFPAQPAC